MKRQLTIVSKDGSERFRALESLPGYWAGRAVAHALESPCPTPKPLAEGELAGCPFCGKPGAIDEEPSKAIPDRTVFIPSCSDSDCIGVLINSFACRAEASAAWNHRAQASGTFADGVAAVASALPGIMQSEWDDFCDDTKAHPDDIQQHRRKLTFSPHQWVRRIQDAIRAISAPPAQGEG